MAMLQPTEYTIKLKVLPNENRRAIMYKTYSTAFTSVNKLDIRLNRNCCTQITLQ